MCVETIDWERADHILPEIMGLAPALVGSGAIISPSSLPRNAISNILEILLPLVEKMNEPLRTSAMSTILLLIERASQLEEKKAQYVAQLELEDRSLQKMMLEEKKANMQLLLDQLKERDITLEEKITIREIIRRKAEFETWPELRAVTPAVVVAENSTALTTTTSSSYC